MSNKLEKLSKKFEEVKTKKAIKTSERDTVAKNLNDVYGIKTARAAATRRKSIEQKLDGLYAKRDRIIGEIQVKFESYEEEEEDG